MRGLSASPEMAGEQLLGLFAAVAAEVGVQQVHHRQRWRPSSTLIWNRLRRS